MPKFESPIGSRQINAPSMREYTVPDESGYTPQEPQAHPAQRPPMRQIPSQDQFIDNQAMQDFQGHLDQASPIQESLEIEHQMMEARRAKREGKERLTSGAKRRIELLIGMTRLTRDVDIGGNVFTLKTLTSKELRESLMATTEFIGTVQYAFETRKQILARSLTIVAGVEVDQFLGSSELQDRLDFIEELDHSVLVRIYNEYNLLAKESQDKYSPKTEEEVKEVLADLKKS